MLRFGVISTLLLAVAASAAYAQPAKETGRSKKPPAKEPAQMVTLDIVIASVHHSQNKPLFEAGASGRELLDRVNEIKAAGKLVTYKRISVTALNGLKAMSQSGSTVPVVSGRTSISGRSTTQSYSNQSVGMLVEVEPLIKGNMVLTNLKIEESRLEPAAESDDAKSRARPPSTAVLSIASSLAIPTGGSALVTLREVATGEDATTVVVIASARVAAAKMQAAKTQAAKTDDQIRIYHLKYSKAEDVLQRLENKSVNTVKLNALAQQNAIIARGSEKELETVEAALKFLDKVVKDN